MCLTLLCSLLPTAGSTSQAETVRYRLEVDNTWSESTHPVAYPSGAHFSWLGGATHNEKVTFWEEGRLASPGMTQLAEDGHTTILLENEVVPK